MPARLQASRIALLLALLPCAISLATLPAQAQFKAWVAAKLPDTPEGLALDSKGNLYATLYHTGEVVMLHADGSYEHIAWVPSKEESGKGNLNGLDFDRSGNLYAAYRSHSKYDATDLSDPFHPSCRDATSTRSGLYRIEAGTHKVTPVATRADGWPFCFPDDVAIDSQGNAYMTDLTYSAIWKISLDGRPDGTSVELWSSDPLLNWQPTPYSGLFLGVNDLVLDPDGKRIYAVTDGDPMVLSVPIRKDGSAGLPQPLGASGYSVLDGIERDPLGNIYISDVVRNEIWVLSHDGKQRILVANKANAPLDDNASLVYRDGVLCTANLGYTHKKPEEADRTVVCMKGFRVPK